MSESFTAVEYAILTHLRLEGPSTIPAIAADLLLRLSETQEALSSLVSRKLLQQDGGLYSTNPLMVDTPPVQSIKESTRSRMAPPSLAISARPAAVTSPADVAMVFKQARERAKLERTGGV